MFRLSLVLCAAALCAQELPRHGVIGLQVGGAPPAVQRVIPGGAGEAAGFREGDTIDAVDGVRVETTEQFVRAIARHLGGEAVRVRLANGTERVATLKPQPYETSPNGEVLYRSVEVRGARRRVIVNRPHRDGKLPAVLVMQGVGCYSLDSADRKSGYGRVVAALEEKGYVTMRVEKTGEGDSEGPPCGDLSATADVEAAGWLAGLRALKSYDFVDPTRVFVFAHSMGPVTGSLIVGEEAVRGWVSVETIGMSWYEYDIERTRVQAGLHSRPDEVDRHVREYEPCSHRFFVEKLRPEELLKTPECSRVLEPLAGVPYTYMQSVADISLGRQWRGGDFPVLVVYGTASSVTTAHQSQYLVDTINRWRPGRAKYVEIEGMGHDFGRYRSMLEFSERKAAGEFHEGLMVQVIAWMDGLR
jgi:uncharacterized protein